MSDPHFGTEQPAVVEALLQLAEDLEPSLCVVSGDLTQRARPSQFAAARAFVERLSVATNGAPQLLVPGNHDLPIYNLLERWRSPYGLWTMHFGADREPVFDCEAARVVGVDTSTPRRRVDGEVRVAQIDRTCTLLEQATAAQRKIVVVHQPIAVPANSERQRLLHGGADAARAWSAAGVDLILGGHIHLPYALPLKDCVPGAVGAGWLVHAGTAVSDRLRMGAPNSVNELRLGTEGRQWIRWDYSRGCGGFRAEPPKALR